MSVEKGIRAISGIPFLPINNWRDFVKVNKQLTNKKTLEKAKEMYQTIVFDEVYTASLYCQDYISRKHGVETVGEGNNGYGLWKQYEKEFFDQIDLLLGAGYTLAFISHEVTDEDGKAFPKGDKRSITPIVDNSDIVVYLTSNGVDDDNKVINSSAWFAETDEFFARSRFDYIDTHIEEFTAENLEKAISEAIKRQEKEEGVKAVTYKEQKDSLTSEKLVYEDLMEEIKEVGSKLAEMDKLDELNDIAEKHLGVDERVTECKKGQEEVMAVILDDLKDLLEEAASE